MNLKEKLHSGKAIVTGIGSRKTPQPILDLMREFSEKFGHNTLRSGGAKGADSAFEFNWGSKQEIYLPWKGFNNRYYGIYDLSGGDKIARKVISNSHWKNLTSKGKKLHSRNAHQILGENLDILSDITIGYSIVKSSGYTGGTRTAFLLSELYGIPVVNLYEKHWQNWIKNLIRGNNEEIWFLGN